ncbi:MAG: putative glycoside hydrolase, partial [Patescibacteria group bacterium]
VYLTSWSGGSQRMIDYVINLARTTELNAVVIDIKDFSGEVAYKTDVPEVKQYGAERIKILNIEPLLKKLHEQGLYVIARVTVFQDPVLVKARPDLAVQSIAKEGEWTDHKGLGWIDPASQEAWNYTVAIARDASSRGFDEINFDYVRFPSDGDLKDMKFPFWDGQMPRKQIMQTFFSYLKANLLDVTISADLFGLSTSSRDDLGIGQIIEDAYEYFDYVYPMVYPSHYAQGYQGYPKPAEYPYEVVNYSMASAQARLEILKLANPGKRFARLRPWLQDFDLGAEYDTQMVQAQVQATQDALGNAFAGFLLWAPTNRYTTEALNPFVFDKVGYQNRFRTTVPNP